MHLLNVLSILCALLSAYLLMPFARNIIMAVDDYDASGMMLVASRNPFRESGPPANMAKLILLRQKIQSTNRRRRTPPSQSITKTHTRHSSRAFNLTKNRSWMRFGRGKQFY